jgi:hypothetical protein
MKSIKLSNDEILKLSVSGNQVMSQLVKYNLDLGKGIEGEKQLLDIISIYGEMFDTIITPKLNVLIEELRAELT